MIEPHSACGATGPGGGASEGRFSRTPPGLGEGLPRPKPRRNAGFPLPRPLPWLTPLSRAWPGTLIACWTVLTTCVILSPRWSTLAIVGGLLLLASLVVRLPLSVAPRPPMWFVSGFIGGCIGAWLGARALSACLHPGDRRPVGVRAYRVGDADRLARGCSALLPAAPAVPGCAGRSVVARHGLRPAGVADAARSGAGGARHRQAAPRSGHGDVVAAWVCAPECRRHYCDPVRHLARRGRNRSRHVYARSHRGSG